MFKKPKLDELVQYGSSTVYFSLNPAVKSGEIWTKEGGLEKAIGVKTPGEAVTLIGIRNDAKSHGSYFLYNVFELIPIRKEKKESDINKVYESMIPGVAYVNPTSLGISTEDLQNLNDPITGPVKTQDKEFLGVINVDYLVGIEEGKVNEYFLNGAYFSKNPEKLQDYGFFDRRRLIKNIGRGAGMISYKIVEKIAKRYGYPTPKPGDIVVGIAYFEKDPKDPKKEVHYAFPLVVSSTGEKMQVPSEAIDSKTIEVVLGVKGSVGKRIIA